MGGADVTTLAVWGCWHLGTVSAVCFAELGHPVVATDLDAGVVAGLRQGRPPVAEPRLAALLQKHLDSGRLSIHEPDDPVLGAVDVVFLAADTAVDKEDRSDLVGIEQLADRAAASLRRPALLVVHSQVPVGTTERLAARMSARCGWPMRAVCVPENLRLGAAIEGFLAPDRLVIGAAHPSDAATVRALFPPDCDVLYMSVRSAEMSKHALNAYLATLVSFSSEIGDLCESLGADAYDVERALRADRRVSPNAPLRPGFGFAGATLGRDVQSLRTLAASQGIPSSLMDGVLAVNQRRSAQLLRRLESELGTLDRKSIALLGLTYKPGTDTLRRSVALEVAHALLRKGALVRAYDPAISRLPASEAGVSLAADAEAAARGADALIVATEWPEFGTLDWKRIGEAMNRPLVFDLKGVLPVRQAGIELRKVGVKG
jgi:UDPglucose 6-dehydrogenase